ncbi:MAG: hypothetical protein COT71_04525 [Candidatus Andersenbacteria bacterium CG10_big_fil_rev_8_21_14_0_10_54_11]|uniref:V-type proton ATPase subunit E n=1 Tax=Candidatus Andersenbacteria bacterium CG10_big_fil_rev_8_21_14_0_10_54_11 TaxID=1974485 RepID=A0A2M6WY64_9BACT|nr:MAG: hypothetical protein COT71_04525 [Candidatus Andersenbacteria bacterium CG10_big_fil_rev_8_21_14_0_10_54_11]
MSFTKLQEALISQAEADLTLLRARYAAEYARTEDKITRRARQAEEQIIRSAEAAGEQEAQRLHQSAQLTARADILRAKQEEITAAREKTIQEILAWPAAEARAFIAALLDRIPVQEGIVTAGDAHAAIVRELASARGLAVADKEITDDGGFVFRNQRTELDATVRRLVTDLFRRRRAELASLLYG